MTFLKSGSLVAAWIKSLATAAWCSFCSGSRSHRTNFATTHFMPRSCVKISDAVVFGIPTSASSSRTVSLWSLLIAAHTRSTFSGVLLVAGLLECGSLSTDSWVSLKYLFHTFICTTLIASSLNAFWIIRIVSVEQCLSLMQHWCRFVALLTQSFLMQRPHRTHAHSTASATPTDEVKLSLFMHVHSSPLSLIARLHWCWQTLFLY